MLKVLKKIYPKPKNNNYNKLNYDNEGLWSITHPNDADIISKTILKYNLKESRIIDLTAGCGGNLLSFGKYFDDVVGIENDSNRFNILKNNISCYDFNINVYQDDCSNYLNKDYDVYFLDPPWGGPDYKSNKNLKLYLSDMELKDAIDMIPKEKFVVVKIPYNYNYDYISSRYTVYQVHHFNNIIIIYFQK